MPLATLAPMAKLKVGDAAPSFSLPDADGTLVSLSDYAGRRVIVYFYPAAMTPGCTTQAVDFTANAADIDSAGFDVVGISPDAPAKLAAFREKETLDVTLLADEDRAVMNAYGAYGTKMLYGKEIEGVIRSTFVVDVDVNDSLMVGDPNLDGFLAAEGAEFGRREKLNFFQKARLSKQLQDGLIRCGQPAAFAKDFAVRVIADLR